MMSSPSSLVLRSRSCDSMTNDSASFTICSSLLMGTGRFSQARSRPFSTFWRSNFSRRPSFFTTMYGISSMRSYVVKRLLHFRHSRRRRIESASLLSRESTTLSFSNPQKGHFMRLAVLWNQFDCSRVRVNAFPCRRSWSVPVQMVVEVVDEGITEMPENEPNDGPQHVLNGWTHAHMMPQAATLKRG